MKHSIIPNKAKKLNRRPSVANPELIKALVAINKKANELVEMTKQKKIAALLNVKQQAISYHANLEEKE